MKFKTYEEYLAAATAATLNQVPMYQNGRDQFYPNAYYDQQNFRPDYNYPNQPYSFNNTEPNQNQNYSSKVTTLQIRFILSLY